MSARQFFIISGGEDGTNIEGPFDEPVLDERFTLDESGCTWYGRVKLITEVPDLDCWPANQVMIIEGKAIAPKPVEVIKKYEF